MTTALPPGAPITGPVTAPAPGSLAPRKKKKPRRKAPKPKARNPKGGKKGLSPRDRRLKSTPFDPLGPGYENDLQFQNAIEKRARSFYQPQLEAIARELGLENSRHSKRAADISSWYGYADQKLGEAHNRTTQALNNLIAQRNAGSQAGQQALLAALNASRQADRDQATTIGGVLPETENFDAALAAFGSDQAGANQIAGTFGGLEGESAGRIGTNAIGRTRAQEAESGLSKNLTRDLDEKRREVLQSIPSIVEEMRGTILKEEREAAAQRLQNKLGRAQLKLQGRELGETTRSNKANEALDAAGLAQDAKQAQQDAQGKKGSKRTEALAKANEWLNDYLGGLGGTPPPNSYIFRQLRYFGLTKQEALKLMLAGPGSVRKWAKQRRQSMKGPKKGRQPYKHPVGSTNANTHKASASTAKRAPKRRKR